MGGVSGILFCLLVGADEPSVDVVPPPFLPPPPLQIVNEAGGHGGILISGFDYHVGVLAQGFAVTSASGRYRLDATHTFADHLYFDGEIALTIPLNNAAVSGVSFISRAGFAFATWAVLLGAYLDFIPNASVQALPSLQVIIRPSFWGISFGIMERPIAPVARIGVELWDFTFSYAFPIGADFAYRPQIARGIALDVHAFGFELFNAFQSGFTVGLLWRNRP